MQRPLRWHEITTLSHKKSISSGVYMIAGRKFFNAHNPLHHWRMGVVEKNIERMRCQVREVVA
jgi:hypothetical protein